MSAYGASFDLFEDLGGLISRSHRIVVPRQVLDELSRIARGKGKAAAAARLGLQLSSRLEVMEIHADTADDAILEFSKRYGKEGIVCTNDVALKNILKARGTLVVGVRDYSHLGFL